MSERSIHAGHRGRMRERFAEYGKDVFHTHELLEMLLYSVIPVRDTNETAIRLLKSFDGLDSLLSRTSEMLVREVGVGQKTAELICSAGTLNINDISSNAELGAFTDILFKAFKGYCEYARLTEEAFANLRAIAEASVYSISEILHGDLQTSVYIKLVFALLSRRICDKFKFKAKHESSEISDYFKALMLDLSEETVYIMSLSKDGRAMACDKISSGTVNYSEILPAKILETARRRGAAAVIVAHNHPGASSEPSAEDRLGTARLREILQEHGIELKYHCITAGNTHSVI